jgi:hypothetical protein
MMFAALEETAQSSRTTATAIDGTWLTGAEADNAALFQEMQ